MPNDTDRSRERQISSDRDAILSWAEEHDAVPARDASGGDDRLRIVPEHEIDGYERLDWDAFFDELDRGDHVVVYHGSAADDPLEVTGRGDLVGRVEDDEELEERLMEGETVTSAVTETRVVESVVVEELTVESELVDAEQVEGRVVDAELVDLTCTDCQLNTIADFDARDWFDADRYLAGVRESGTMAATDRSDATAGTTGSDAARTDTDTARTDTDAARTDAGTSETDAGMAETGAGTPDTGAGTPETGRSEVAPSGREPVATARGRELEGTSGSIDDVEDLAYRADVEVAETWEVEREVVEQYVVESRVTDKSVTEADTIEDYDLETAELHRSIVDQGLFETERPSDEVLAHYDVESELSDPDVIQTTFTRERRVADEIVDRKRLHADFQGGDFLGMELLASQPIDADREATTPTTDTEATTPTDDAEATTATDDTTGTDDATAPTEAGRTAGESPTISEDAVGNTVLNAEGDEIGMVSDVDESAAELYVDVEPGMAERIMATLGWSDADEEDYPLTVDTIRRVTDDEVWLKGREEIEASGTGPGDSDRSRGDHT